MASGESNENYNNIIAINGPYICLRVNINELFTNDRKRALSLLGCALSRYDSDNLMYAPVEAFKIQNFKKNLFIKEHRKKEKNKINNDHAKPEFLTPMVAIITKNKEASKIWSEVNENLRWNGNVDELITEKEELEFIDDDDDDNIDCLENTLEDGECILFYTTQIDLLNRLQLGYFPFHLKSNEVEKEEEDNDDDDEEEEESNASSASKNQMWLHDCSSAKLVCANDFDNPKKYADKTELKLDSHVLPIKFMTERKMA